ncbi:PEF-CTERM sorting domain-containing protein [Methanosarcina sp. KYL-1]|uniref:PEF-CTERM sorting domain-containing protein n=1 Tax=Methanosarcina sp. KYL-1 TaxID=2602068 RepID=UPI002100917D|nr:PEF-CTERM sorting domain-containing protein [Methanosarcina sp. KYL-1]
MKKSILLLASALLMLSLAGSATASPSFMYTNPGDIYFSPSSIGYAAVVVWDINWDDAQPNPGHHNRIASLEPEVDNLEARLIIKTSSGDFVTNWATKGNPVSVVYNTEYNNYVDKGVSGFSSEDEVSYRLEVQGSATGQIILRDKFETDGNEGSDSAWASPRAQVPEFPTVALPVAAILGLVFIFGRKKEGL